MGSYDNEEERMDEDEDNDDSEDIVLNETGKEAEKISFTRSGRSINHKRKMESDFDLRVNRFVMQFLK